MRIILSISQAAYVMDFPKTTILKCVELALTIACLGMHYKDAQPLYDYDKLILIGATFGGYLIILIGLLVGVFTGQPVNKRIDIFFSLVGFILCLASGAVIIKHFDQGHFDSKTRDLGLSKGSLAIINGVVFLLDSFFTYRDE